MLTPEESKEIAQKYHNYDIDFGNKQKTDLYTYKFSCTNRIINFILNSDKSITIVRFIK